MVCKYCQLWYLPFYSIFGQYLLLELLRGYGGGQMFLGSVECLWGTVQKYLG